MELFPIHCVAQTTIQNNSQKIKLNGGYLRFQSDKKEEPPNKDSSKSENKDKKPEGEQPKPKKPFSYQPDSYEEFEHLDYAQEEKKWEDLLGGEEVIRHARRPEIVADAAHAILTRDSRATTGNFFIDEDVLCAAGVTDFEPYAVEPGESLFGDFFV